MIFKSSATRSLAIALTLATLIVSGCDSNTSEHTERSQNELERACYHFSVEGALEFTAICQDHQVTKNPDGSLRLTLIHPPLALVFELPPDVEQAEYKLRAPQSPALENSVQAALYYNPLDSLDRHFDHKVNGSFTVLRQDGLITALFSFHAQTDEPEAPAVKVRGHLRDLPL